jgi:ABC-2 type transport system ATP-binding protein
MVLHVTVADNPAAAGAMLSQNPGVESVNQNNGFMEVSLKEGVQDYSFVPQQLVSAGFKLTMLREEEVNLETAFMRLTKGMVQ